MGLGGRIQEDQTMTCPDCQRTTGHDVGCVYPPKEEEMTDVRTALQAALEWISKSAHGDNCFLTDDPPIFDQCYCGKDALEDHLTSVLEKSEPA